MRILDADGRAPSSPLREPTPGSRKYDQSLGKDYTFKDMLRYYNKGTWIPDDVPPGTGGSSLNVPYSRFRVSEEQQFYFKEWYYCSPEVIDEELLVEKASPIGGDLLKQSLRTGQKRKSKQKYTKSSQNSGSRK